MILTSRSAGLAVVMVLALGGCGPSRTGDTVPLDGGASDMTGGGGDGSTSCTGTEMRCGGSCIDTSADNHNCGSCGNACPSGVTCAGATCSCAAPRMGCGGACVDTETDATNCGACGTTCASTEQCVGGSCVTGCDPPRMVCPDGTAAPDGGASGVCSNLQTDTLHCGTCANECPAGSVCTAGHCACPTGQQPCGGVCIDVTANAEHCGGCRVTCGAGGTCTGGTCTGCGPGFETCPGTLGCVDTQTSQFHCGACGHPCIGAERCTAGTCGCTAPSADCSGECVDLTADPLNCGACGNDCGPDGGCADMTCICPSGSMMCGTTCADTTNDPHHCGDCTTVCPGMQVCVASACIDAPLYHGWTSPIAGCDTTSYDTTLTTVLGGTYPSNASDSLACRAWKLAATICNDEPVMYSGIDNWQCTSSGGFTDPVFGTYCASPASPQYACSTCPGACNASCIYTPLSLRDCSGRETTEM